MAEFGPPTEQIVLATIIVSTMSITPDVPKRLLGGRAIFSGGDWSCWLPSPANS